VFVLLAATILFTTVTALADDVADEADHLFSLGTERYQERDYKAALQHFLASNRLVKNRNAIYNIARTYEQLQKLPDAYRYYQRALEGASDSTSKARILDALRRIGPSVALLRIETDPPGASIFLERKDLGDRGASPQTLALVQGTYDVIAELPGYLPATSVGVEARVGASRTVVLKLTRVTGTVRIVGANAAEVRVDSDDGPVACVAPCDVPIAPGQHMLTLAKAGSRLSRLVVQVRANTTLLVRPELSAETGTLVVNSDERAASIEVDGRTLGFTPAVLAVPVGKHTVRVATNGFRPVERTVEVRANEQATLDVQLVVRDDVEAASRVAESVDSAPASVSLVSSPELRAMRYPTVAEAVRGVRGVYVQDDRSYKSLGFRGFSQLADYGNRVLVLVDGHPTNDNWIWASYVGYDLRADIDDVDRIEVVRGPGSVLYGTGAFSGVVNLVTLGRDTPEGREVGISVAEDGVARARARFTQKLSKDAGVTTSLGVGRSRGIDFFSPDHLRDSAPSLAGTARGIDGMRVGTWTGRLWYKSATVQWSVNHHDKNVPSAQFETLFGDSRMRQWDSRAFVEAKVEPNLGPTFESLSRVHGNYVGYRGHYPYSPSDGGVERVAYDGAWIGVEQRILVKPTRSVRITGGGEAQYHFLAHDRSSTELFGSTDDRRTFSLFAGYGTVDVTPSSAFKLSAAARVDAYSTFGSSVSPRIALVIKPYDRGNIKLMGGKAFRAPSFYELFGEDGDRRVRSTGLAPENLYSAEVEYSHRFSRDVVGLASAYSNYITDLIALRDLPGSTADRPRYSYANTNVPVGTIGGEFEVRREWRDGFTIGLSYSVQKSRYLKSDSFLDYLSFAPSRELREVPNSPEHLASLKGAVPILGRALMAMSRLTYSGRRFDRNDANTPGAPLQGTTPGGFLWDIVLSGTEQRLGFSYAFGVYNAFDTALRLPVSSEFRQLSMPQLGRTFLATGALTF